MKFSLIVAGVVVRYVAFELAHRLARLASIHWRSLKRRVWSLESPWPH
jgi:hypothetical protein